ncbi:GNAT family N-acetyltransferase [bacterium]|nr:GNAT family N-acetyltransferase [bacterium]
MLVQAENPVEILESFGLPAATTFTLRHFIKKERDGARAIAITDNPQRPGALLAHDGSHFMMLARDESVWPAVMNDLFHERIEQDPPWPDEQCLHHWEEGKKEGHKRGLFLDQTPLCAWQAAIDAGFASPPDDDYSEMTANVWYAEGKPRFSHLVKHPCRLGKGLELLENIKKGVDYDEEGNYIRMCLEAWPSFTCEVDGEKVCWSCTHLSGTMGMIYTPPEHRRKGYAKSLAAFQIDYMLRRDGLAICHVINSNYASQQMLLGFGFEMIDEPLVWRPVLWPD